MIFGTLAQFKTLSRARAEAERLNLRQKHLVGTQGCKDGRCLFGQLIDRYKQDEMPQRFSTSRGYSFWLERYIRPKWGSAAIENVEPVLVEQWLRESVLSPKSKSHLKGLMTILFNMAMKWKLIPLGRNPMELVTIRGGVKRRSRPSILTQQQFGLLVANIPEGYVRVLVILGMCLGLRFSELLALKWRDIDWEESAIFVRRAIVLGREGDVKTEYSEAPAPLDPVLAKVLQEWKRKTEFSRPSDWIFASPFMAGRAPYFPTIVVRKIHAAGKRAGLSHLLKGEPTKILRHSYRSWLGTTDAPVAIIKDLMRHADIRTTFNQYGNMMQEPMRQANSKVVQMALRQRAI
ncbi:MAG: tyrosine-type recombinase/integrase [Candidatus Angelobacter sp.]